RSRAPAAARRCAGRRAAGELQNWARVSCSTASKRRTLLAAENRCAAERAYLPKACITETYVLAGCYTGGIRLRLGGTRARTGLSVSGLRKRKIAEASRRWGERAG